MNIRYFLFLFPNACFCSFYIRFPYAIAVVVYSHHTTSNLSVRRGAFMPHTS